MALLARAARSALRRVPGASTDRLSTVRTTTVLRVRGIPVEIIAKTIETAFGLQSAVASVSLELDADTGLNKGVAHVTLAAGGDYEKVRAAMHGTCLGGYGIPMIVSIVGPPDAKTAAKQALALLVRGQHTGGGVLELFEDRRQDFDIDTIAAAFQQLSKIRAIAKLGTFDLKALDDRRRLDLFLEHSAESCAGGRWRPEVLAAVARRYVQLEVLAVNGPALLAAIADELTQPKLARLAHKDFADVVRAYSEARQEAPQLFEDCAAEALARIEHLGPRDFSRILLAYALFGGAAKTPARQKLFAGAAQRARRSLRLYDTQEIANVLWAFDAGGAADAEFCAAAAAALLHQLETTPVKQKNAKVGLNRLGANSLARTALALTAQRVDAPKLFEAFCAALLKKIEDVDPDLRLRLQRECADIVPAEKWLKLQPN